MFPTASGSHADRAYRERARYPLHGAGINPEPLGDLAHDAAHPAHTLRTPTARSRGSPARRDASLQAPSSRTTQGPHTARLSRNTSPSLSPPRIVAPAQPIAAAASASPSPPPTAPPAAVASCPPPVPVRRPPIRAAKSSPPRGSPPHLNQTTAATMRAPCGGTLRCVL